MHVASAGQAYDERVKELQEARDVQSATISASKTKQYSAQRVAEQSAWALKKGRAYVPNYSPLTATSRRLSALARGVEVM